jgi:hypothetical protein
VNKVGPDSVANFQILDDATLYDAHHAPLPPCEDKPTRGTLAGLIKGTNLPAVMAEAALRGSIGSVAVLMRVLRGRVFWSVLDTLFLTPDYDPEAPDRLLRVTERYKVRGNVLPAMRYDIADDKLPPDHWFQRAETWFLPQPVTE